MNHKFNHIRQQELNEIMQNGLEITSISSFFFSPTEVQHAYKSGKEHCDHFGWAFYLDLPLFFARSSPRRAPKTITKVRRSRIRMTAIITVRLFTIVEHSFRSLSLNPNFGGGLSESFFRGSNSIALS